jgi:hypothetical protein
MELTPQQKKKAEKLISVLEKGDVAVMEYMLELEDKVQKVEEDLKREISQFSNIDMVKIKIKGDKGDTYILNEIDKQEIAEIATSLIDREEIRGEDGENYILTEKDKKDIAKNVVIPPKIIEKITIEKPIITEITKEVLMDGEVEKIVNIIEKDLPKLGDSIRDGLELLQGENRLDASAIKNLPTPKNNQNNVVAGVRIFDALLNVNTSGKVDGSVPEWDSTTGMWIMGTGGLEVSAGTLVGRGASGTATSYEGSNDDFENNGTGATAGQSFQVSSSYSITSVSIYGSRGNSSSGTFKIEIKTGSPTGTVVATTGTLSSSTLSAYSGTPSWNQISLIGSVTLTPGITYYLVATSVTGSSNDEIRWSVDATTPSYTGGSYYSGTTADTARDRSFRISGSPTTNEEITLDSTLAMTGTMLGATGLFASDVKLTTAGNGFYVKEGSNATMGTATANGTTEVTVSTTKVTATSRIFLTCQTPGGTPSGVYYVSSRSAGISFGFKSLALDTSTIAWIIIEPA